MSGEPSSEGSSHHYSQGELKEFCGVMGVCLPGTGDDRESAYMTYLGLNALQHRGQEACGISTFRHDGKARAIRDLGLVSQVFGADNLSTLTGHTSIGHVRYSTMGGGGINNVQPVLVPSRRFGRLSLAHNGNLTNVPTLQRILLERSIAYHSDADSELAALLLADELDKNDDRNLVRAVAHSLESLQGAFSLAVALGKDRLVGARDRYGFRPLHLGRVSNGGLVLASETCAFQTIGAEHVRPLEPGEVLLIQGRHTSSWRLPDVNPKLCLFEMIYFARPDSVINGIEVNAYREELGRRLAETAPPPPSADIVVGVPDSGTPAALGYARTSSIPYTNALIKNRYVGRTFIQPSQALRELGIRMKLNFLPSAIQGKSVVLIDDSIVRGNTPRALVALLREGGAREVHMRISSPPILWGCHYGIAMRDEELIARHLGGDPEAIRRQVGADSLSYLDLGEALAATSKPQDSFCTACFSGLFPAGLSEA